MSGRLISQEDADLVLEWGKAELIRALPGLLRRHKSQAAYSAALLIESKRIEAAMAEKFRLLSMPSVSR